MKSPPRQRFVALSFCLTALALLWVIQPFAPRFEGATVRQWVDYYLDLGREPEPQVVAAFGLKALPDLLARSRPGASFVVPEFLDRSFIRTHLRRLRDRDFDRRQICKAWAESLASAHPGVFAELLLSNWPLDEKLAAGRLLFGEIALSEELKRHARTNQPQLQARATEMLELSRALF